MKYRELAQMPERSILIREAPGSIPGFSREDFSLHGTYGGNDTSKIPINIKSLAFNS